MIDTRILRLRVELFSALQMLNGEALAEFVSLIRELYVCLPTDSETEIARARTAVSK